MAEQERTRGRRERRSRQRQRREQMEAQRRRRYMIGGGVIGAFILLIVALTVIPLLTGEDEDEVEDTFPPVQAAQFDHDGIASEPYFLGDPDAPVHLIEWSDYQ